MAKQVKNLFITYLFPYLSILFSFISSSEIESFFIVLFSSGFEKAIQLFNGFYSGGHKYGTMVSDLCIHCFFITIQCFFLALTCISTIIVDIGWLRILPNFLDDSEL
jgi:hypothetical protein